VSTCTTVRHAHTVRLSRTEDAVYGQGGGYGQCVLCTATGTLVTMIKPSSLS
jgi:hypothetical protein